jgi:peptidoglycan-associated lipoprotein
MKKTLILTLAVFLIFGSMISCRKKVEEAPPPPPQAKEQPKVEKVVEPPVVKEPVLSEEEIFSRKSLEEINAEQPLMMVHFDYDKFFIRDDAKSVLESNASWLNKWTTVKLLIEGHCDERGTEEYNLALGEKRAKSTLDYLASLGISPDRLKIISYGKSQPLDPASNETAWGKSSSSCLALIWAE